MQLLFFPLAQVAQPQAAPNYGNFARKSRENFKIAVRIL
jgi:hypothetical protein